MNAQASLAVAVSFVAMSAIGIGILFVYWAGQDIGLAAIRSTLFVVVMGCVHLAGYLLYVQQFSAEPEVDLERRLTFDFSPKYWPAIKSSLVIQLVLGVLTALMLDGGRSFGVFQVALIGYWIAILIIMGRRPLSPTSTDIVFVRFGILIALLLVQVCAPMVWSFIGESQLSGWERLLGDGR